MADEWDYLPVQMAVVCREDDNYRIIADGIRQEDGERIVNWHNNIVREIKRKARG